MPSAPTQYSQIPGPVGNLPGLVVADANGAFANVVAPWYYNPSTGLWTVAPADGNGTPLHEAVVPVMSGTLTIASTNSNTQLPLDLGTVAGASGLIRVRLPIVRLVNNTNQAITGVALSVVDTVAGQTLAITTPTVPTNIPALSGSTPGTAVVPLPPPNGVGGQVQVTLTFVAAPTSGTVAVQVDWVDNPAGITVGPRQIASIPYSQLPANTTGYFSEPHVLSRHARARTLIVTNSTTVGISSLSAGPYDSAIATSPPVSVMVNLVAPIPGAETIATSEEASSNSSGLLAAHVDSVLIAIGIGSTAPSSGAVTTYVTELFG
jgi:hypothetical protein